MSIRLVLYVAGTGARSTEAVSNLRQAIAHLRDCNLRVVDVAADPRAAEDARLIATPSCVREAPPPELRVVGDMSNAVAVRRALSLPPPPEEPHD